MFGFSSLSQLPFATLPSSGIPAQATLTSQTIESLQNGLNVAARANIALIGEQLNAYTGNIRTKFGYFLTGQTITGYAGDVVTKAAANTTLSGQELQSQIANLYTVAGAYALLVAQELNISIQDVITTAKGNTTVTGQELISYINSVTESAQATATLVSQELQVSQDDLDIVIGYLLTGISMSSVVQSLNITGAANTDVTGILLEAYVNNLVAKANASSRPVGQALHITNGGAGAVTAHGDANVFVDGIQALIQIQDLLVWGQIPDGQDPHWDPIDDSQTGLWTKVDDSQTTTWSEIQKPTTGWVVINDSQTKNWKKVIH